MTANCTSLDYAQLMSDLLNKLIVKGLKVQPRCVQGWRQSIHALTMLWNDVKTLPGVEYLCTRKLLQDPLENCFSVIRSIGGFSDNLTASQFANAYKQVLLKHCIS